MTAGFPFGMGETFLETEVKYLAEGFDNIKIVAINPSNQTRRSLPENCHATALHIKRGRNVKLHAPTHPYHCSQRLHNPIHSHAHSSISA